MKKIFFVGILSILFVGVASAQPRIGITAGLNVSNLNESGPGSTSNDFKAGFQAGLVADFGITESFSIMPELLFGQRGAKTTITEEGISINSSLTLNYLQLPVNLAYKFDTGYGSNLFVFAGPYIGYGLSASMKGETKVEGTSVSASTSIKFGSEDEEIKPFDFGLNVGVGYQYEKIFFKLQFNPGLYNLSNVEGGSMKNTNVAVTVGYYIN